MSLYLPAGVRQIATDPKHPFYHEMASTGELVIVVNGEIVTKPVIVADEINGYVKCVRLEANGDPMYEPYGGGLRLKTYRLKGKVELFIRGK